MTNNKNSTRYYSSRQEKKVAKAINGRTVANSGAIPFGAGDVTSDQWLLECKTCTKEQKTFTLRREWFSKNEEEAFAMRKPYNAIVVDFGDGEQHYIISERLFKKLKDSLEEDLC